MASVAGTNDYSALDVRGGTVVPENPRIESPQRAESRRVNGAARSGVVRDTDAGPEVAPGDDADLRAAPRPSNNGTAVAGLNGHSAAAPVVHPPAVNGKPTRIDSGHAHNGEHAHNGVAGPVEVVCPAASPKDATAQFSESPLTESPLTESPVTELPVTESPVTESPVTTDDRSATREPAPSPERSQALRATRAAGPASTRRIAVPWSLRRRWICQRWVPVAIVGTCAIAAVLIWRHQVQPLDAAVSPPPAHAVASPASDDRPVSSADDAVVHYDPSPSSGRR